MRFHIDSERVHQLLNLKFGGIDNFVEEWASVPMSDGASKNPTRSVKTVYKWLRQGMPKAEETFFSFFGALDSDPISLVDLEKSQFHKHFGRLRQALLLGGINIGGFRPLLYLLRPSPQWPEDALIKRHYKKAWTKQDFVHDALETKNLDVTFRIKGDNALPKEFPRAYHIAYRRLSNADGLWRPFGTVITRFSEAILVHENGAIQSIEMPYRSDHQIDFKTFFGPSPAEFRVASLHPFAAQLELFDDPDVALQFAG